MDLHSFHSLVHTQAMLQARIDQASMPSMMQLRIPGGILDVSPLPVFERKKPARGVDGGVTATGVLVR